MTRQLICFIENRAGALGEVARTLAEAGVNIESILLEGMHDFGAVRLHVDALGRGEKALRDAGFQVQTGEVLVLPLANHPGALAEVCEALHEARVNIESVWGTAEGNSGQPALALKVDDIDRARAALRIVKP